MAVPRVHSTDWGRWRKRRVRQWQAGDHIEIQNVLAVHEQDLTALLGVQGVPEPVACSFRNLAARDDEGVVDEHASGLFRVEDLVRQHHEIVLCRAGLNRDDRFRRCDQGLREALPPDRLARGPFATPLLLTLIQQIWHVATPERPSKSVSNKAVCGDEHATIGFCRTHTRRGRVRATPFSVLKDCRCRMEAQRGDSTC